MPRPARALIPVALAAIGVGLCALAFPRLRHDTSLEQLFDPDAAIGQQLADFDAAFGTDDLLLVVVRDRDPDPVFRPAYVRYLDRVVAALESQAGVDKVVSLANLVDVAVINPALPPLPRPLLPARRDRITPDTAAVLAGSALADGIVAPDGTATACWVLLAPELRKRADYLERARRIAAAVPAPDAASGIEVITTGFPLLQGAALALMWRDAVVLLAAALVVVTLVAVAGRVPWRAALGFLLSWPAIGGTLACLAWWTEQPLGLFSNSVLPLLLITTSAAFVHFGRALHTPHARSTLAACGLATATTAIGFGSLALSALAPLAALGVAVAVGTCIAFALGTLCTWCLATAGPAPRAPVAPARRRPRRGLPAPAVAVAAALLAVPWFALDAEPFGRLGDVLRVLPDDHPRARDARTAAALLGAQTVFEVVVAASDEQMRSPDFLLDLAAFERALQRAGGDDIPFVLSPVTMLRHLDGKLPGGEPGTGLRRAAAEYAIRYMIGPYLDHFRGGNGGRATGVVATFVDWMRYLLSTDGDRLRFGCRTPLLAPERILALRDRLQREVFAPFRASLGVERIYATGYSVLVSAAAAEVRATQRRSLAWSGLLLAVLLLAVLRSPLPWLLAVGTNVLTVSSVLSLLWVAAAGLNLYSSVLMASLLAILVDDTVHLACGLRRHRGGSDPVAAAVGEVAPSIALSSACLAAGFAVFAASGLPDYRQFAWTAPLCIALALFWDLLVLPRLLGRALRPGSTRRARTPS